MPPPQRRDKQRRRNEPPGYLAVMRRADRTPADAIADVPGIVSPLTRGLSRTPEFPISEYATLLTAASRRRTLTGCVTVSKTTPYCIAPDCSSPPGFPPVTRGDFRGVRRIARNRSTA